MSEGRSHLKGVALLNSGEVFAGFTVERLLGQGAWARYTWPDTLASVSRRR